MSQFRLSRQLREWIRSQVDAAADMKIVDSGITSAFTVCVPVAGFRETVSISPAELVHGYGALMRLLRRANREAGRRIIVGLAGIPGSGKSTTTAVLAELWREALLEPPIAVVGMDGWHLTNAELDRRFYVAPDGSTLPLRRRKGSPPSFDAVRLAEALRAIRNADHEVRIPVYDRTRHEPIADAGLVPSEAGIVLVEGNYLLLDEGPWADVYATLDLPIWLDVDPAACREGILARHIAGGMRPQEAADKYAENDLPNAQIAMSGRRRARWLIQCDSSHRLVRVCAAQSPN